MRLAPGSEVECRIEGHQVVHVVGIGSPGPGMRIITDRPLPAGQEFSIAVDPHDGHEVLDLKARAVWQESWDFEFCNRYIVGIEFLDVSQEGQDRLARLLPRGGRGERR